MNNQPKIEAFNSFYQQGKDLYNAGDIMAARDAFIKAAELANDIAINATSYDVRMEYHKTASKILEFIKKSCVKNPLYFYTFHRQIHYLIFRYYS